MRRKEILYEFTNVNSKLIEEAAEYRPANKNLVRALAIAACLAMLVTSIPLALIMNQKDKVQTPNTTLIPGENNVTVDPQPLKVIYCDANSISPEYLQTNVFKDKNIKVENFEYFSRRVEWKEEYVVIARNDDIPEKLTFSLSNKVITANFDILYNAKSNSTNEELQKLEQIARYKIEGTDNGYIYYCVAAKAILKVVNLPMETSIFVPPDQPKYTIEEIEDLALTDFKSVFGEKILEKYSKISSASIGGFFYVIFERMIGDYDTGSYIILNYAWTGELYECEIEKFEHYYFAEHLLNEKKLLDVEKEAQEIIGENLVCEKKLMLHKDGFLCVRYILYLGYYEVGSTPATTEIYFRLE